MDTVVKWAGHATFIGKTSSGHSVVMDGPSEGGGRDLGPRPMELLTLGMGACSAYDVVSILRKSRQKVVDCEARITSKRANSDPKVFTHIHIHFLISGYALEHKQIARAIDLSAKKYCSASIMLSATANITHDFEIINVLADAQNE